MLVSWRVYYCYRHGLAIVAWFFWGSFVPIMAFFRARKLREEAETAKLEDNEKIRAAA